MKHVALVLSFMALGCGGGQPDAEPATENETPPPAQELPPMPAFPAPQSGMLQATSAGAHSIEGAWEAKAGVCEDPGTLQVMAEVPGAGTLVLLRLPSDDRIGTYPIAFADSGMPAPPAARVGVQVFREDEAHAFRANDGMVELYSYGDHVSGRLAVTLEEIQSKTLTQYAGVFAGVQIEPFDADYCERLKAALAETRPWMSGVR